MSRKLTFAVTAVGLTVFALLTLSDVPHYHSDVTYIMLLVAFMLAGLIGAITIRSIVFPFAVLAVLWIAFYLINSIRFGFLKEGFIAHLAALGLLAASTVPVAVVAKFIRNRSRKNGHDAT